MAISLATRQNADLIDQNYEQWRTNPASVDANWAAFFEGFELGNARPSGGANGSASNGAAKDGAETSLQTRVDGLVYAYRTLGPHHCES